MKRKLLSLLLALCMVFALAVTAGAEEVEDPTAPVDGGLLIAPAPDDILIAPAPGEEPLIAPAPGEEPAIAPAPDGEYAGKTVILHTNDVHGAIESYAKVAALKAEYEAKGAEVILVDAGDYIQGTTYVSDSQGATAIALMNAAGYDVATLGNHEFDYGYANLVEIYKEADFKVISNAKYNGALAFDASYVVDTAAGLKLGIFGLATPETATKTHPAKIAGMTFDQTDALYAYAQEQIDALRAEGCDVVMALAHLGVDEESKDNRSVVLYANVTGLDMMIDGHSHTVMTEGENGEAIQSTGTKLANVGVIVLGSEGIESNELVDLAAYEGEDETVKALSDSIIAEIEAKFGAKFAETEVLLNGEKAPGNRTEETNLGDLITDAMLWYATKDGGLEVDNDHVVALTNGGGIRATIAAGDITMNDINTVLPFGNTVAIIYVSGNELLEALEASTYCTPTAVGGFPQTCGIKFTVDTTVEFDAGDLYPGSTYSAPASIKRVTIESINGKAFDPAATYAVVSNDFCAAGGDTYFAFSIAENVMDTGTPMDVAVMEYITEVLGGKVTAEKYGETRGDITISTEPAEPEEPEEPEVVTYKVVKGDCLWKIAKKFYGAGKDWTKIYEANKSVIKNPNLIYVGQVFEIPA